MIQLSSEEIIELGKKVDSLYDNFAKLDEKSAQDLDSAAQNIDIAYNEIISNPHNMFYLVMYSYRFNPPWEISFVRKVVDYIEFNRYKEEANQCVDKIVRFIYGAFVKTSDLSKKNNIQEYIKLAHVASYKFQFHRAFYKQLEIFGSNFKEQSYRIICFIKIIGLGFSCRENDYFELLYKFLLYGINNLSGEIQIYYIKYFIESINSIACRNAITTETINDFIDILKNSSEPALTFTIIKLFCTINNYFKINGSSNDMIGILEPQYEIMGYLINALTLEGAINEIDSILGEIIFIINDNNYSSLLNEDILTGFVELCTLTENDYQSLMELTKIFEFYDGNFESNRNYVLKIFKILCDYDFEYIFNLCIGKIRIEEFTEECLFLISGIYKAARNYEDQASIKNIISDILATKSEDVLILINQILIAGRYNYLYEMNDVISYFEHLETINQESIDIFCLAEILAAVAASKYDRFYVTFDNIIQIYHYYQKTMDTTLENKIIFYIEKLLEHQMLPQENIIEFINYLIITAHSIPKSEEEEQEDYMDFEEERSLSAKIRLLFILVPFATQQNYIEEMFILYNKFYESECSNILSTDETPQFIYAAVRSPLFDFDEQFERLKAVTDEIIRSDDPANQILYMNRILMLRKFPESYIPYFREKVLYFFDKSKFEFADEDQISGAMLVSNSILQGLISFEEALEMIQIIFTSQNEEEEEEEKLKLLKCYYSDLIVRSAYLLSIPVESVESQKDVIMNIFDVCLKILAQGVKLRNIDLNLVACAFRRFSLEEEFGNTLNEYPPDNDPVAGNVDLYDFYRFDDRNSIFQYVLHE